MQKIEIQVFRFDELADKAKEKARADFRATWEYPWFNENMASLKAFVGFFGGHVLTWSLGDFHGFVKTDLESSSFEGLSKVNLSRDHMPTGYIADSYLWEEFYDTFHLGGYEAFQMAIEAFIRFVARDVEDFYTDESIDDTLIMNEYDYLPDGSVFARDFRRG